MVWHPIVLDVACSSVASGSFLTYHGFDVALKADANGLSNNRSINNNVPLVFTLPLLGYVASNVRHHVWFDVPLPPPPMHIGGVVSHGPGEQLNTPVKGKKNKAAAAAAAAAAATAAAAVTSVGLYSTAGAVSSTTSILNDTPQLFDTGVQLGSGIDGSSSTSTSTASSSINTASTLSSLASAGMASGPSTVATTYSVDWTDVTPDDPVGGLKSCHAEVSHTLLRLISLQDLRDNHADFAIMAPTTMVMPML